MDSERRYEDVINQLEMIKANSLDVNADYEAVEKFNKLIYDLKSYYTTDKDE